MTPLNSDIKKVYDLLGDDISKYIFEKRLMYSMTADMKFIRDIVSTIEGEKNVYTLLQADKRCKGIFGSAGLGRHLVRTYENINFECFVDNARAGEIYEGLPVISLNEFNEKFPNSIIVIAVAKCHLAEVLQQLLENGISEENIIQYFTIKREELMTSQYFDLPQLFNNRFSREVFVDGGSYDGKNALEYVKKWGGQVIAWEPDINNQQKCLETFRKNNIKFELIPKGLWSEAKKLQFKQAGGSSSLSDCGDEIIETDSIDSLISTPVSFIKMDIEGAEYQAILGAKKMISKYKPRLAICVYHKPDDIWKLPYLIYSINPSYTFYLRHYSFYRTETVLYAI